MKGLGQCRRFGHFETERDAHPFRVRVLIVGKHQLSDRYRGWRERSRIRTVFRYPQLTSVEVKRAGTRVANKRKRPRADIEDTPGGVHRCRRVYLKHHPDRKSVV